MKLVPLHRIFSIKYGNSLELINLEQCSKSNPLSINYVSRTEKNNGISAFVKRNPEFDINPSNTISVAVSGSVLSSFLQPEPYYTGFHIFVLTPLREMSKLEMLFYCQCIRANKYKYNYGRQANRTLKDVLVPESFPKEFQSVQITDIPIPSEKALISTFKFDINNWGKFRLDQLFEIKKGKRLTKEDMEDGNTPFIGAIDSNNGYRDFISHPSIHEGNTITVNYNGSVAEAFYQPLPFWASDDVNVLYARFEMNVYMAMFIVTIIKKEKYRFNYGRKWNKERMEQSGIYLPMKNGQPDFTYMENFIKSLPYSSALTTHKTSIISQKKKAQKPQVGKGLSDRELIKKYENGEIEMGIAVKKMAQKPK